MKQREHVVFFRIFVYDKNIDSTIVKSEHREAIFVHELCPNISK